MMSKKQWTVLLMFLIMYLILGAAIFHNIEVREEQKRRHEEMLERNEISELLHKHYEPDNETAQGEILEKLETYCDKPMTRYTEMDARKPFAWDFYHSFFFSFTVVSTIGYGNLAPTCMLSRIIMMFYGLIGIPINGILLATLGEFFGRTFINAYRKWKSYKKNYESWRLGLCGQIACYLIPGITFFIFIPSIVISHFEGWDYDVAVYYAYVTLTTVGFGDIVAGVKENGFGAWYMVYKVFLIVWIVFGLGYLIMIMGFISRAYRSKQVARIEHKLALNIKNTHSRLWNGVTKDLGYLRRILNELYMMKFKPVYRDEFPDTPTIRSRSHSCPELMIYNEKSPTCRRRAYSVSIPSLEEEIGRVQSDTDLERIDKRATFASPAVVQPSELLARVVDALGSYNSDENLPDCAGGIDGFSDSQILASEKWKGSQWTIGGDKINPTPPGRAFRARAFSAYAPEFKIDKHNLSNSHEWTWSGPYATKEIQKIRQNTKQSKPNNLPTLLNPTLQPKPSGFTGNLHAHGKSILSKFRNPFGRSTKKSESDVEAQPPSYPVPDPYTQNSGLQNNLFGNMDLDQMAHPTYQAGSSLSIPEQTALEKTTIGELLRAINSIHRRNVNNEDSRQRSRKMGTGCLTPPELNTLMTLFPPNMQPPQSRRGSLRPLPSGSRRMSMKPTASSGVTSATNSHLIRRFSVRPVNLTPYQNDDRSSALRPQPPPYSRVDSRRTSLRGNLALFSRRSSMIPEVSSRQAARWRMNLLRNQATRTRHDSLTDVRIEKP